MATAKEEPDRRITVQWRCGKHWGRLSISKNATYRKVLEEIAHILEVKPPEVFQLQKLGSRAIVDLDRYVEEEVEIDLVPSSLTGSQETCIVS